MSGSSTYACALILRDSRVLLGRRATFRRAYPGCWDVIGGRVEPGETPKQALIRELAEEVAIKPVNPTYAGRIEDRQINPDAPPSYLFFRVRNWSGGEPRMNNHEHSDLEWFTLQQAQDLANLAHPEYRALLASVLT